MRRCIVLKRPNDSQSRRPQNQQKEQRAEAVSHCTILAARQIAGKRRNVTTQWHQPFAPSSHSLITSRTHAAVTTPCCRLHVDQRSTRGAFYGAFSRAYHQLTVSCMASTVRCAIQSPIGRVTKWQRKYRHLRGIAPIRNKTRALRFVLC